MKRLISNKTLYFFITIAAVVGAGTSYQIYSNTMNQARQAQALDGLNTCSKRVYQSFTALMIRDLGSPFLSSEFKNTTDACFNQVGKILSTASISKITGKILNNITSDVHWFYKKINKIIELNEQSYIEISQSNVATKFEDVESLIEKFKTELAADVTVVANQQNLLLVAFGCSQLLLIFSLISLWVMSRLREKELSLLNERCKQSNFSANADFVNIIMPKLVPDHSYIANSIKQFTSMQENKINNYETALLKLNTESPTRIELNLDELINVERENKEQVKLEEKPIANFHKVVTRSLTKIQSKAFEKGIIIDSNLAEDFNVYAQEEALESLVYHSLMLAIGKSASEGNKIVLRSKPLGGIAYYKIQMSHSHFSNDEINFLNGREVESEEIDSNLLSLKELLKQTFANVAIRNKQNQEGSSGEIEFIFERHKEAIRNLKSTTSMKGNKEEIRRFLSSNN